MVTTSREDENFGRIEANFNLVPSNKDLQNSSISSDNLKSTNISVTRTISKPIKPKVFPRKKARKSNKIVIIDLTTDIAFERCIKKKRKSRKVVWLQEAKKKFDAKTIRASQKIKKQQTTEKVNSVKKVTLEQQLEDSLQPVHTPEKTCLKNDLSTSMQETKLDDDKAKRLEVEQASAPVLISNTESEKQSMDMNSSDENKNVGMHCTVSSSVIVDRPQSNKSKVSTNSLLDVSDDTKNVSKCHNVNATSEVKTDEKINDRFNIQTVIKRLIEKDTTPESETCKRVESLRKICDLGMEHSKTVNSPLALCAQGDSKDEDDSCNHNANYPSIVKDKLSPHVISSLVHTHHRNNEKDEITEKKTQEEDISDNDRCTQNIRKTMNNEMTQCLQSNRIDGGSTKGKLAVSATAAETRIVTTTVKQPEVLTSGAMESEELRPLRITAENTKQPKEPESQDKCVSTRHDVANNTVRLSVMNGDHSNVQTDLEVGICIEVSDDVKDNRSSNHKIRETIFENCASDKKNISNIVDMSSLCSKKEEGVNSDKSIDPKTSQGGSAEIDPNKSSGEESTAKNPVRTSVLRRKVGKDLRDLDQPRNHKLAKETYGKSYKISHVKNMREPSDSRCIIQDPELQDNIDGLSLLASVSQHVSHLKTERELKCDQIKVKDYASLRSSPCNQSTDDDETNVKDLSNTVSRILENPSTEMINRIVGIYPEDALDKVALHVEVTSTTDVSPENGENDPNNSVSRVVETTINYETDTLSNNLSIAESNVQSIKENTNVILNGETVVLLKKSPNSNLYTINKAYDESRLMKEKSWMVSPEDCTSFEVVNTSEHISFNLDLPQYKEPSCQENKFAVGRNKSIKIEPEEEGSLMNIAEMKPYGKKGPLPGDVLPATSQIYQDTNVASVSISKSVDKRKSKSILAYRQNIKQEFNSHITPNCGIQGCNGIHSHPHEVIDPQHSLHIPVTHPTTIPSIYGNCAAGTDLCMPYHKHCTSVSCSLQINSTTSLHSHTKSATSCGRSHCSCLNCTYDIVTHCRQCIHPATDSHVSCIESNSYFLPTHSSVQTSAVQEHDRTKSEAVIGKLYDDQILCKIEQRVLQNNTLEKLDVQREPDKLFQQDMENKLPLKKRLKAMMSMAYEEMPIKAEKLVNYPGIRMMSIAALEAVDGAHKHPSQIIKSTYELSPNEEDGPHGSYHFNSNVVRRDYYKDMHISNTHHNLTKESTRSQFRSAGDQSNAVCLETCQDRTFGTSAQHRDVTVMNPTSMKRITTETMEQDGACKKPKKTQSSIRQTRSSKRNVPKVNYCYTDVDPEWNPSGESKRRRKKTSR